MKTQSEQVDSDCGEKSSIDYNMPKPGPHAKAGEWRKWKMMKRTVRQEREERRLQRQMKKEEDQTKSENEAADIKKQSGRDYTISIAIPGSIIGKIISKELKSYVAGQIARIATLFSIDEIIVYNEYAMENKEQTENNERLIKVLEYLECPQYLRKTLFPPHKYLEYVGLLNPIESTHHLKRYDNWIYREGVVVDNLPMKKDASGSWVDVGLINQVQVDRMIQPGVRVTVKSQGGSGKRLKGVIVSPNAPREEAGLYWGYQVRYAESFRKVIFESVFNKRYDFKVAVNNKNLCFDHVKEIPRFKHGLIVFAGIHDIEAAIEADEKLKAKRLDEIFDYICQDEVKKFELGSRSIRLEELLLLSLTVLHPLLRKSQPTSSTVAVIDDNLTSSQNDTNTEGDEESQEEEEANGSNKRDSEDLSNSDTENHKKRKN